MIHAIHEPLLSQTEFQCGLFDTRTTPDTCEFNPTLIEHDGNRFLITRKARLVAAGQWNNTIASREIDDRMRVGPAIEIAMKSRVQQYEDPRAFLFRGFWHVGCANYINTSLWKVHQSIHSLAFDGVKWVENVRFDIPYRGNGSSVHSGTRHEKNWTFFDDLGRLKLIYQAAGHHEVADATGEDVFMTPAPAWNFGELRGGSCPIRVGSEYWCFFHSSTPWVQPQRRYHMGVYAFEASPPYRITRMSRSPILSGSQAEPRRFRGPLVVFPGGALLKNGVWTVVFGVNDEECGWINIPHAELERMAL